MTDILGSGTFRRRRFGAGHFGAGHFGAGTIRRQNFFFQIRCSAATLFRFVARFARGRIEDSSFNRFALNGIQEIACFIVFSSLLKKFKKNWKRRRNVRRRNVRRRNGTAPNCPAPNRRRRNGGAETSLPPEIYFRFFPRTSFTEIYLLDIKYYLFEISTILILSIFKETGVYMPECAIRPKSPPHPVILTHILCTL